MLSTNAPIVSLFQVLSRIVSGPNEVAQMLVERENDREASPLEKLALSFNRARKRQERFQDAEANHRLAVFHNYDVNGTIALLLDQNSGFDQLANMVLYTNFLESEDYLKKVVMENGKVAIRVMVDLSAVGGWESDPFSKTQEWLKSVSLQSSVIDVSLAVMRNDGAIEFSPIQLFDDKNR